LKKIDFPNSYFLFRHLNDSQRLKSFENELSFMLRFTGKNGSICDLGCSTGEFLDFIQWDGKKYGTEINKAAIREAKSKSISIISNFGDHKGKFDVIVMRGTIQHFSSPFEEISFAYNKLKVGGFLFFLATPNIDSLYYRFFGSLPALDYSRNYWLPGFKHLKLVCEREGFELKGIEFPYTKSGYVNWYDFVKLILKLCTRNDKYSIAFPRNMMNLAFQKTN